MAKRRDGARDRRGEPAQRRRDATEKAGQEDSARKTAGGRTATPGFLQRVAGDLKRWVLVFGVGLGAVGASAAYFGLFLLASTFVSIFIVSVTLYAFLRFWPEDETPEPRRRPSSDDRAPAAAETVRRPAIPAVQANGPPRARMMLALREIARRQDHYKISKQGAERFAKVIRYLLQNEER